MRADEYIDAHAGMKPGHRTYGCAFMLSKQCHRIMKHVPPCVVELCSFGKESDETSYRSPNGMINYVVPVKPDGTLDWRHAVSCHGGVCLTDTRQEIEDDMSALYDEAITRLDAAMSTLDRTKGRVIDLWLESVAAASNGTDTTSGRDTVGKAKKERTKIR